MMNDDDNSFDKDMEEKIIPNLKMTYNEDSGGVSVNLNYDNFSEDEKKAFRKSVVCELDQKMYEGEVEHAYSLEFLGGDKELCPRCHSPTQQYYANFIYATHIAPRVMFVPAGYFCTHCSTVVIDQQIIRAGVSNKFRYQGVLGIDYDSRQSPDLFQTWNGKKSVYILDEEHNMMGLTSTSPNSYHQSSTKNQTQQKKKKKRIAKEKKQAKKRNRRKR